MSSVARSHLLDRYRIDWHGLSEVGLVRTNNEDVWGEVAEMGFFALADGMGGHRAGEIAAKEAIESMCKEIRRSGSRSIAGEERLEQAIQRTNFWVYELSRRDPSLRGMGTTLCCLLWEKGKLWYAHVGDSRIYLLRDQQLTQLTQDHSLQRDLEEKGLRPGGAFPFPSRNVITRAIGTSPQVTPEIGSLSLQEDDWFLLCSDGLTDLVPDESIQALLLSSTTPHEASHTLLQEATTRGGRDNITIITIRNALCDKQAN